MRLRRDSRLSAILVSCVAVAVGGIALDRLSMDGAGVGPLSAGGRSKLDNGHTLTGNPAARRAHQAFQQSVAMLQAGHFEFAVSALHDVLAIYPTLPEAHANMGYALLGLDDHKAAADFFESATSLNAELYTAYYGLAIARAGLGDFGSAIAAMQTYAHLAGVDDPYLENAQSAMSRWNAKLGESR